MSKEDRMSFEGIIKILNSDGTVNKNDAEKNCCTSKSTYQELVSCITSLPPKQFILLSSLIGILIIDNIDVKDQFILGKFISNIGHTILTAAAQEQVQKKEDK
jgi:hypothetical protein